MADKFIKLAADDAVIVQKTLRDMGDGTYAEVVAFTAASPVQLTGAVALDTFGAINDAKVIDPDAASATIPALLRGLVSLWLGGLKASTATIGAVLNAGPNWTTAWGIASVPFNSADASAADAPVTSAPTAGQKLVIDDITISVGAPIAVTLKEETSGTVFFGPFYMAANSSIVIRPKGKGKKLATADKKLTVRTSGAGNVTVDAGYHSEA